MIASPPLHNHLSFTTIFQRNLNWPCKSDLSTWLLAGLESAYSLIRGAHEIWGQSLGTFMISSPIYKGSDW